MDLQHLRASDGTGEAVLAHVQTVRTPGSTVLDLDNVDNWNTKCIVVTGTPAANGFISPAGMKVMYGHITAGDFIIDGYAPGYVDNGNTTAEVAIVKMTTNWADGLIDILKQTLADNGKIKALAIDSAGMFSDVLNPVMRLNDMMEDFIVSGGNIATVAGLVGSMSNIVYYINGVKYSISSIPNKTYTASKDTYVDVNSSGAVVYTEVAVGAASPALAANHKRVMMIRTSGAAITLFDNVGYDTLGNRYYNTVVAMPSVAPITTLSASADQSFKTNFWKPKDIMTLGTQQKVRYQPYLRNGGAGSMSFYRIAYMMTSNVAYTAVEPGSGVTAGDTPNYQTIVGVPDASMKTYYATYDFAPYTADTFLRVDQHRDGAGGSDTNPNPTDCEGVVMFYNKDYTKAV